MYDDAVHVIQERESYIATGASSIDLLNCWINWWSKASKVRTVIQTFMHITRYTCLFVYFMTLMVVICDSDLLRVRDNLQASNLWFIKCNVNNNDNDSHSSRNANKFK